MVVYISGWDNRAYYWTVGWTIGPWRWRADVSVGVGTILRAGSRAIVVVRASVVYRRLVTAWTIVVAVVAVSIAVVVVAMAVVSVAVVLVAVVIVVVTVSVVIVAVVVAGANVAATVIVARCRRAAAVGSGRFALGCFNLLPTVAVAGRYSTAVLLSTDRSGEHCYRKR